MVAYKCIHNNILVIHSELVNGRIMAFIGTKSDLVSFIVCSERQALTSTCAEYERKAYSITNLKEKETLKLKCCVNQQ